MKFLIFSDNSLLLRALICSVDGKEIYETKRTGSLSDFLEMGQDAAMEIKKNAQHILSHL